MKTKSKKLKTGTAAAAVRVFSHEQIATCAYLVWEREGRPQGREQIHWQEAESQLRHYPAS
jgi:hypothetical protein